MDVGQQSSPKGAPSVCHEENSVLSQESLNLKSEDNFVQDNVIDKNEHSKLDFLGANKEMRVEGTSYSTSEFSGNCQSKEQPSPKPRVGGIVITRKTMQKIKGYDFKMCSSFSSPLKQCLRSSELFSASENHAASVCSHGLIKRIHHDCTAAAPSEKKLSVEHCKTQFRCSAPVQECAPPQSDWIPFEFVDSSVTIEKEVATVSDVSIDDNMSNARLLQISPSASFSTECSASEKKFSCKQCTAQFTTNYSLRIHLLNHSSEGNFPCDQCSARFNIRSHLKKHMLVHSNEQAFTCDQCSAPFKRKVDLNQHLLIHSNPKAFSCDHCSAQFYCKSHLKSHMLIHSDVKAFTCCQCSAQFKKKGDLQSHLVIHSNQKTFFCDLCPARFNHRLSLRKHVLAHSNEKQFSCDLCSARFNQEYILRRHVLRHSNKKTFSCDQCSIKFAQKHNLQRHLLVHLNEKVFACNECSAQFKRRQDLGVHLLTHAEGSFSCKHCSAQFQKASQLMSHSINCFIVSASASD